MKRHNLFAAVLAVLLLWGCAAKPDEPIQEEPARSSAEVQEEIEKESAPAEVEEDKNVVTLFVYDGRDEEYILENEQAETISNLFYNHEMELYDTPIENVKTLEFQIGEDTLSTSMGDLKTLNGTINGETVIVDLSDDEYEAVYQIASQYAQGVP